MDTMASTSNTTTRTPDAVQMQPEETRDILIAVIGILSVFSVIGTVGNVMVLYVYVRKRNKLASTVFIITLACTDFVTCILVIPYTAVLEYVHYYIKYDFLCKSYMFLITSNVPFSAFIMMAIAVDRYLCICHPFSHLLNTRRAKIVISILAIVAFVLGIITALNYGVYTFITIQVSNKTASTEDYEHLGKINENDSDIVLVPVEIVNKTLYTHAYGRYNISKNWVHSKLGYSERMLVYNGSCQPNGIIFRYNFTTMYQKIYSSFFVIVIVVVMVLYIMIYRFVTLRRARRRRMRSQTSGYSSCKEHTTNLPLHFGATTRVSITNGCVNTELELEPESNINGGSSRRKHEKSELNRQLTIREKGLVANIRTAAMLFVVTAVFIVVFLPAWLMAHQVIPYNMLVFYMYFFYNVANPIIYAFMNKSFRRALMEVIECRLT